MSLSQPSARSPNSQNDKDPLGSLVPLRRNLGAILSTDMNFERREAQLDHYAKELWEIDATVFAILLDSSLPLSNHTRTITQALNHIHNLAADGYVAINKANAAQKVLRHTSRQLLLAHISGSRAPQDIWALSMTAWGNPAGQANSNQLKRFGAMLALEAAQPESMMPRELMFLDAVLEKHAHDVIVTHDLPQHSIHAWYWLDATADHPPASLKRQSPPSGGRLLFFNCTFLAERIRFLANELSTGTPASLLGLPAEGNLPDYQRVLHNAIELWCSPVQRQHPRRKQGYRVKICTRLSNVWQSLVDEVAETEYISEWIVQNESPAGYAIMHLTGSLSGLTIGGAIGLRTSNDAPWSICLIRSMRSNNASHVELGLEMLSATATAVRIVPTQAESHPIPALLLPPIPNIVKAESILFSHSNKLPNAFALVVEQGEHIQVTQCRRGNVLVQTSSIDIFEFSRTRQSPLD